ncbi:hypothetical protein [Paenarthrobacter nicotinovorans]|uniref:hypothetical protein n=1 Tax=Paenarthrobacter nicotinovorans TaxID=29320 RepID=UPI001FD81499|nr:hypothetical protein [Paenarthrobacter nicotinovorans]
MPIEFLGMGAGNDSTETSPATTPFFDPAYAARIARIHEDNNWDHVCSRTTPPRRIPQSMRLGLLPTLSESSSGWRTGPTFPTRRSPPGPS